jgi:hypothetical protein
MYTPDLPFSGASRVSTLGFPTDSGTMGHALYQAALEMIFMVPGGTEHCEEISTLAPRQVLDEIRE